MCRGGVSGQKPRFSCHDTDRCAASYVSRWVSGPKKQFLSRDTDRCADSYVSRRVSGPKTRLSGRSGQGRKAILEAGTSVSSGGVLPNPDHLPQIDHKDGNYLNNYADNLRWVNPADNTRNPNTIGHLRGNRKEQRNQREARKMIQRLERMRTNDRCIITDQYMICFDRINNYYLLTGTETSNSPVRFE